MEEGLKTQRLVAEQRGSDIEIETIKKKGGILTREKVTKEKTVYDT